MAYKVIGPGTHYTSGTGTSLNFSKTGIEFTTEKTLPPSAVVEFSVDWPTELNAQCALKFVGKGHVVRSAHDRAAVKIHEYEFRTRRKPVEGSTVSFADPPQADPARRLPPRRPD